MVGGHETRCLDEQEQGGLRCGAVRGLLGWGPFPFAIHRESRNYTTISRSDSYLSSCIALKAERSFDRDAEKKTNRPAPPPPSSKTSIMNWIGLAQPNCTCMHLRNPSFFFLFYFLLRVIYCYYLTIFIS